MFSAHSRHLSLFSQTAERDDILEYNEYYEENRVHFFIVIIIFSGLV